MSGSCSCPRQTWYVSLLLIETATYQSAFLFDLSLPSRMGTNLQTNRDRKAISHRCSSLTKGPEVREYTVVCSCSRTRHWGGSTGFSGSGKRGIWREAGLEARMVCRAGRGVYAEWAAMGDFSKREVKQSLSFFVKAKHLGFICWCSVRY